VAVRALSRTAKEGDRLLYDHLFDHGDRANQEFYAAVDRTDLSKRFLRLGDPITPASTTGGTLRTRAPAKQEMTVIPQPAEGTRNVFIGAAPLQRGAGDITYVCGSCGELLAQNLSVGQSKGIVFRCPKCGAHNEIP
jgi:predicted RNA-binding Zn-ribbon protein involved in translation (DUF1610 family)